MNVEYLGISFSMKNMPALDEGFIPFAPWRDVYLREARRPVRIAVERQDGQTAVFETRLRDGSSRAADLQFHPDVTLICDRAAWDGASGGER